MFNSIFLLLGRTLSLDWRMKQLKGLLRLLDENEAVFVESLGDLVRQACFEHSLIIANG